MNRRTDVVQTIGLFCLAALVIGFIGTFALVYHGTTDGTLALGALLPLAGMIGHQFFQLNQQGFLGGMLQGQRQDLLSITTSTLTTPTSSSGSTDSASSAKPPATSGTVASPAAEAPAAVVTAPWTPPAEGGAA